MGYYVDGYGKFIFADKHKLNQANLASRNMANDWGLQDARWTTAPDLKNLSWVDLAQFDGWEITEGDNDTDFAVFYGDKYTQSVQDFVGMMGKFLAPGSWINWIGEDDEHWRLQIESPPSRGWVHKQGKIVYEA